MIKIKVEITFRDDKTKKYLCYDTPSVGASWITLYTHDREKSLERVMLPLEGIKKINKMKEKYTKKQIEEFLRESNKIEGVHSEEMFEDALKAWRYLARQKELTYEVVLETHRLLMVNSKLEDKYIGKIRDCDVFIGGRAGLSPNLIRGALSSWLKDVETSVRIPGEDGKHFKLDHIEYERIHGFADGNGRTRGTREFRAPRALSRHCPRE